MKKEILILEVNGKNEIIDYQRTLYEAAILGISSVMLIFSLEDNKFFDSRLEKMTEVILKTCKMLEINPIKDSITFYGYLIGNSVGVLTPRGHVEKLSGIPKFSDYKKRKENKEKIDRMEDFEDFYSRKGK